MKVKTLTKILAVLFFIFVCYVIIGANLKWKLSVFKWVSYLPLKDKAGHFLILGVFSFFANLFFEAKKIKIFDFKFLKGSFWVFVFITLEEFSQIFIANRSFDLIDLGANYLGIFVFGYLAELLCVKYNFLEKRIF